MSVRARIWVCLGLLAVWGGSALPGEDPPRRPAPSPGQVHEAIRQLRRAAIKPPATGPGASDVREAVRRLQALRLRPRDQAAEAASRPASQPASAPASQPAGQAKEPIGTLPPYVLQEIRNLPARKLVNPAGLADALFLGGHAEAACGFYELALKSEPDSAKQAWLLYQVANSRQGYDPSGARQVYDRLVAEHPECPWGPLAKVQALLIEWYEVNDPEAMLAGIKVDVGEK